LNKAAEVKLLFDCHTFDVGPQGTSTFLAGLLNALPRALEPDQADLVCAAREPTSVTRFVDVPHRFRAMSGGFVARNLRAIPRLTEEPGIHAVVSQYVRPFRSHVPTVSIIHDVLFLDFPTLFGWRYRMVRRLLFGWAARHSDVVITVSNYSRDRIAHHFGIPPDRIDVLPNAVEVTGPPPTRPVSDAKTSIRLLYVSRFETRKRQHWCVAAANALAAGGRPVELTFVGDARGAYADSVRTTIAADRTPGVDIKIMSDVSNSDLDILFASTDLFLFPSECEGFGIPVIEAAAHGIPCVVAVNTALAELTGRYAGVAFDGPTCDAFVGAVKDAVARLPALREEAAIRIPETRAAYRWLEVAQSFAVILRKRGVLS
jgi:glycosyltransferase involved in cell wall biosynthesis